MRCVFLVEPSGEEEYLQSGGRLYASDPGVLLHNGNRSRYVASTARTRVLNSLLEDSVARQQPQLPMLPAPISTSRRKKRQARRNGEWREHDELTTACLNVSFVPWFKSTIGLSRPPTPEPRSVQRYHRVADSSVDSRELSQLPESQADKIVQQLSSLPGEFPVCAVQVMQEVNGEYTRAMKLAVLNYLLRDPEEQQRLGIRMTFDPSNRSAGRDSFPWHDDAAASTAVLHESMFTYHPVLLAIQDHFRSRYFYFRFINFDELQDAIPLTLSEFIKLIDTHTKRAKTYLNERWLVEYGKIVDERKESIESWVMNEDPMRRSLKMDIFFSTLAQLMSLHLRYFVESTLQDLLDLFAL